MRLANDSRCGPSDAVFSADVERATQFAARMQTRVVEISGAGIGSQAPFGGVKESGIGREQGEEGFEPYVEILSIGLSR